jgi:hypothetical protein
MAQQSNEDRAVSAKPSKGGLNLGVVTRGSESGPGQRAWCGASLRANGKEVLADRAIAEPGPTAYRLLALAAEGQPDAGARAAPRKADRGGGRREFFHRHGRLNQDR